MLSEELELRVQTAAVLAVRDHPSGIAEVLICWQDLPKIWRLIGIIYTIQKQFPDFHLEDKVKVFGGVLSVAGPQLEKFMLENKRMGQGANWANHY